MKKIFVISCLLILSGCGYKIVNLSELNNYGVNNFDFVGDKRINFIVKNRILNNTNDNSTNRIDLSLKTTKKRTIKEKNIKNEITKYSIDIKIDVKAKRFDKENSYNFSVRDTGDYNVSSQNSLNRTKETDLIKMISNKLANKILEEISYNLDDL